jgi:hypothetical protein
MLCAIGRQISVNDAPPRTWFEMPLPRAHYDTFPKSLCDPLRFQGLLINQ